MKLLWNSTDHSPQCHTMAADRVFWYFFVSASAGSFSAFILPPAGSLDAFWPAHVLRRFRPFLHKHEISTQYAIM
ncbi:hypothetical protein PAXRUDRAFT_393122 [Paxillus rubicundulus Ve08.2h10]|uniref:Uncharacterized protein n=1 Tax=Paxillus rubicundulus Ve08.2h10 TaxID=930991 RepID=A0A0D0CPE3_9AGAM|nr:hypothetical protein PAXRUDRAFT_393122 [Paxillus rubicundulus Ve08.2h10]